MSDHPCSAAARVVRGWLAPFVLTLAQVVAGAASAQEVAREQAVHAHARAIEAIGSQTPADSLRALEAEHFAPGLFTGPARDALAATLADLRPLVAGAGMIELSQRDDAYVLAFRGSRSANVLFSLEAQPPYRITRFVVDTDPAVASRPDVAPMRWEALDASLKQAEQDGFAGVVLAVRQGRTLLARGYGRVDPQRDAPPTLDTVFDIGSMPIDFTRAAIFGLAQDDRVTLEDPIRRFFPDAPPDKAAITLGQLMDGSSGLANFHHRDSDVDKDLTWIDRETALRRIFAQPLLFAPGSGRSHSHSAFGLLAAVVEQVSGQSYGEHLQKRLFGPAGMTRTGFYGQSLGLPDSAFAVGGGQPASTPNIPTRWGPASWLVIGSGGMVASVGDMRRAHDFIAAGRWLRGQWLERYQSARVGIGGSERGFLFLRATAADASAVFLASHSHHSAQADEALTRALINMVLPQRAAPTR